MPSYLQLVSWLEQMMMPCLYRLLFNTSCPGCGLQRSFFLLIRGDLSGSLAMYWATIPILLMFVYCLLYLVYKFPSGPRVLIFLYSFNGILIICQYIYTISQRY